MTFRRSKFILLLLIPSLLSISAFAQDTDNLQSIKKGQWYVYWGWNGSQYTKSDIHFEGADHNFTLSNVIADDRQTKFTIKKYFHPEYFSTPQYNFRIGKYLKNNWDISLGIDHMKYVVRQGQSVHISGDISDEGSEYNGTYDNDIVAISLGFLQYEHTDGLNYINIGLRKRSPLSSIEKKLKLDLLYGAGMGALVPKSDVTLLGKQRHDVIHLSGYGIDINGGLRLTFKKRWFLQTEIKTGYINLTNVRTTIDKATKAKQQIGYLQYNILIGGNMFLKKAKSKD